MLDLIRELWKERPDERLGQLLGNAAQCAGWVKLDLFYLEDMLLMGGLETMKTDPSLQPLSEEDRKLLEEDEETERAAGASVRIFKILELSARLTRKTTSAVQTLLEKLATHDDRIVREAVWAASEVLSSDERIVVCNRCSAPFLWSDISAYNPPMTEDGKLAVCPQCPEVVEEETGEKEGVGKDDGAEDKTE